MAWNGTGTFQDPPGPEFPAIPGDLIRAEYFNTVIRALCAGFSNTLPRDGQAAATGDIDMGNLYQLANLAQATVSGQAVRFQEFRKMTEDMHTNKIVIAADYTLQPTFNGLSAGPVTIAPGITVTVSPSSTWSIV